MARKTTKKRKYPKSPFDWYVEQQWVTEQLLQAEFAIDGMLSWGAIWDPACGQGNVLRAAHDFGYLVHATDIAFRGYAGGKGLFQELDFLGGIDFVRSAAPKRNFSIVSNPPYSYKKGISEAFVRRALELATDKVAMLLPVKWQASQARHRLFTEFPPARIWVLSERPSMPPGDVVKALGDAAFKRGKVDYMWVVWDVAEPTPLGETKWRTIAPRVKGGAA
jgi:hypothetical protein